MDAARLAISQKHNGILVNKSHLPYVQRELLIPCFHGEDLPQFSQMLRLNAAAHKKYNQVAIVRSLNFPHKCFRIASLFMKDP
jgi:hypothetical protein